MNSKSSKNSFRNIFNINTKKQKNTSTTNKVKQQKNFNITTTMLYLSTINNINTKHNNEILTSICDKLFIIINHVITFLQQLSRNNKSNIIESLTFTTKDTLLNELHSLCNFLSFNISNPKEIDFTIQSTSQFTLCDNNGITVYYLQMTLKC